MVLLVCGEDADPDEVGVGDVVQDAVHGVAQTQARHVPQCHLGPSAGVVDDSLGHLDIQRNRSNTNYWMNYQQWLQFLGQISWLHLCCRQRFLDSNLKWFLNNVFLGEVLKLLDEQIKVLN